MSDNKSFETMRDLVRLLQQAEYGLRTGTLSTDDVDKACDHAREFYERLVVIRHKAREARVREEEKALAKLKAKAVEIPKPTETVVEAPIAQEAPATKPVEKVVEAPIVTAAETPRPVEKLVEAPIAQEAPASKPAEKAVEAPIAKAAETPKPAEKLVEVPIAQEAPAPKPVEKVVEAPIVTAAETPRPAEKLVEAPIAQEAPAPKPVEKVVEVPVAKVAETPKPAEKLVEVPIAQEAPAPKPVEKVVEAPIMTAEAAKPPETIRLDTHPVDSRQTTLIEAIADKEKAPVTGSGPKTASDYLRGTSATPSPAPEMAAIRAQQVIARPAPVLVSTTTLAEKMEKAHITDLAKSVSVSHKFWFTTELFNSDKASYESGIALLNSAKDLAHAKALLETEILPKLKKPAHEEALNAIGELLQRRFE